MEKVNNFIWILSGNNCFKVFSDKKYAEEYIKIQFEKVKKIKKLDKVPPVLDGYIEIEKLGKSYREFISVNGQLYSLHKSYVSDRDGQKSWWHYELLSEKEWNNYCEDFFADFEIKRYKIEK